jgi:hypothetical protein
LPKQSDNAAAHKVQEEARDGGFSDDNHRRGFQVKRYFTECGAVPNTVKTEPAADKLARLRRGALEMLVSEEDLVQITGDRDLFVLKVAQPRFFVVDSVG